jgi:hypothetical protein
VFCPPTEKTQDLTPNPIWATIWFIDFAPILK